MSHRRVRHIRARSLKASDICSVDIGTFCSNRFLVRRWQGFFLFGGEFCRFPLDSGVLSVYTVLAQTSQNVQRKVNALHIIISNASDKPLYQQIKDQLKDAILKGELHEGDALPSIRSFAGELSVSVLTVRRVYDELEQEGFAVSQAGRGTFVFAGNLELLREAKRRLVEEALQNAVKNAKLFGITRGELLAMLDILYEEE